MGITVKLLKNAMDAAAAKESKSKFLIDGYPRNLDNVTGWEKVIGESAQVGGVFFFDCSQEAMQKRLLIRGESSGRDDDNLITITKRFNTYISETRPIIDMYEAKNLVYTIKAEDDVDSVWEVVKTLVQKVETSHDEVKVPAAKVPKIDG